MVRARSENGAYFKEGVHVFEWSFAEFASRQCAYIVTSPNDRMVSHLIEHSEWPLYSDDGSTFRCCALPRWFYVCMYSVPLPYLHASCPMRQSFSSFDNVLCTDSNSSITFGVSSLAVLHMVLIIHKKNTHLQTRTLLPSCGM